MGRRGQPCTEGISILSIAKRVLLRTLKGKGLKSLQGSAVNGSKRVFEKGQEQVRRLSMSRIVARWIMVSEVCTMYS